MRKKSELQTFVWLTLAMISAFMTAAELGADQNKPPENFDALFDGKSLAGWWRAGAEDPRINTALAPEQLAKKRRASLVDIQKHWRVENGELVNDGHGLYLTTEKFDKDKSDAERGPYPKVGPIQLQTHGGEIRWRNIFIRKIGSKEAAR